MTNGLHRSKTVSSLNSKRQGRSTLPCKLSLNGNKRFLALAALFTMKHRLDTKAGKGISIFFPKSFEI
jgi:hypothetical protein